MTTEERKTFLRQMFLTALGAMFTLFLVACTPDTEPQIKTGMVISVNDTIVSGKELLVIVYYTEGMEEEFRVLYPVESLKPGAAFYYIENK